MENAAAQKARYDDREQSRREKEQKKVEAQGALEPVKALWEQIDLDDYRLYGLSRAETGQSWSSDGIPGKIERCEHLIESDPEKALTKIASLRKRLEEALDTCAENKEAYAGAKEAVETARGLEEQVSALYNDRYVDYGPLSNLRSLVSDAEYALGQYDLGEALELAQEAQQAGEALVREGESAKAARAAVNAALKDLGETPCRVCGEPLGLEYDNSYHWCEEQSALRQWVWDAWGDGDEDAPRILELRAGDEVLAWAEVVEASYGHGHGMSDYEMRLVVNDNARIQDDGEVRVVWMYDGDLDEHRVALLDNLHDLKAELAAIEHEREMGGRVEGVFQDTTHGLQFEGVFTGGVDNEKDPDGYSYYENQPAIFAKRRDCHWLDEEPQAGERWICTVAFQIVVSDGKPVIVVNPQMRTDHEERLRNRIAEVEAELEGNNQDDDDDTSEPSVEDLAEAWGAKIT
jgi:hypothetical protein